MKLTITIELDNAAFWTETGLDIREVKTVLLSELDALNANRSTPLLDADGEVCGEQRIE